MTNAVLLRNLPLTVRDVSSSGCQIESSAPLQVGTVGWLEVEFEGERRFEWFRIARVQARGEHEFVAGVEFLPLAVASADSFRSAIGRLRQSAAASESSKTAEGSSGDGRNSVREGGASAESSVDAAGAARKIVNFFRRR
jgi:hypothetical protein